jgi:hypothetical protein
LNRRFDLQEIRRKCVHLIWIPYWTWDHTEKERGSADPGPSLVLTRPGLHNIDTVELKSTYDTLVLLFQGFLMSVGVNRTGAGVQNFNFFGLPGPGRKITCAHRSLFICLGNLRTSLVTSRSISTFVKV